VVIPGGIGGIPREMSSFTTVILLNVLLTAEFVAILLLSVWAARLLLGSDAGPDRWVYVADDQLADSA
jgi:hypothetical protein